MKLPLKLKILLFLQRKIEAIPEGTKAPKWLIRSCLFVTWLFAIPDKAKLFFRKLLDKSLPALVVIYFKNLHFVFFTDKDEAKAFTGWSYRWFAKKYADKRAEMSKVNKLCGGKRHYVIPYDTGMFIVINRLEVNKLKSLHLIKNYNIKEVFENAYYVTK